MFLLAILLPRTPPPNPWPNNATINPPCVGCIVCTQSNGVQCAMFFMARLSDSVLSAQHGMQQVGYHGKSCFQFPTNHTNKSSINLVQALLVTPCSTLLCRVKPGSYFLRMRMRSDFDVNLTSHPPFAAIIRKGVEQRATAANCSLRICDVKIRFAFAFAGSMNRTLTENNFIGLGVISISYN